MDTAFVEPKFAHDDMAQLAAKLFKDLNVPSRPPQYTEKPFEFDKYIEVTEEIKGEGCEVLWFKFRLLREWQEGRIKILENDVKDKQQNQQIRAKFGNNPQLVQVALRQYWNRIVRTLNESVQNSINGVINNHKTFLQQRENNRLFTDDQTKILEEWYSDHSTNPYPSPIEKIRIAWQCHILPNQVSNWFSNKRMRSKKEKPSERTLEACMAEEPAETSTEYDVPQTNYSQLQRPLSLDSNLWSPASSLSPEGPEMFTEFVEPDESFYKFHFL